VASLLLATSEIGTRSTARTSTNSASRKIEFLALIVPCAGVLAINQFVIFVAYTSSSEVVDLIGLQWYWIADGSDIALQNSLMLGNLMALTVSNLVTISSVAVLLLSAVDVIHAVAVPSLGIKADAIPGRLAAIRFESDCSGLFAGQCSELCGAMHGFMPVQLLVVSIEPTQNRGRGRRWSKGKSKEVVGRLGEEG